MYHFRQQPREEPRRGVILVVVLALLTLFAVVGLSFVFYAKSSGTASLYFRESGSPGRPDVPADQLASFFLGQFLYDTADDSWGVTSALRGHSLARLVYGYNDQGTNATPFCGTGRLHAPGPLAGTDDYALINYTYFSGDSFVRDPERLGWRKTLTDARGLYTGGLNVPYTYPDLNNLFLAAVKADGTVLMPSYHRPWLFNAGRPFNDPGNPNWTNQAGKYLLLRPRPADMGPGFPYPADASGDVKNLIGGPSGNDSVWMDLGFPVLRTASGRKFKPLFAALVVDLDGRVNLNVHGNVRGRDGQGRPVHASNQGWGAWEVNLGRVLPRQANGADEWPNLLLGSAAAGQVGRYGPDRSPGAAGTLSPFAQLFHSYAQIDFDGCQVRNGILIPTLNPFLLPTGARPLGAFPTFPSGYGNGSGIVPGGERWNHPSLYNFDAPQGDDRPFAAADLADLLLYGSGGGTLLGLCPQNFADPRTRGLVTTHSGDFDSPGAAPWLYDPGQSGYAIVPGALDQAPAGPPLPFPPLALRNSPVPPNSDFGAPGLPASSPGVGWRSLVAALGRVDLNRPLTPYPLPAPQTLPTYNQRFDTPALADQFQQAQRERQQLADDVYNRLLRLAGVPRSAAIPAQPTAAELAVRRWLAQLAVNIVDFIDEDDISTPFNFYTVGDTHFAPGFDPGALQRTGTPPAPDPTLPRYWVFGTELPHVVLNEALVEYQDQAATKTAPALTTVRTWVELYNPLPVRAGSSLQPQDGFPVSFQMAAEPTAVTGQKQAYAPFQVVLATGLANRPNNDNVQGAPATVRTATTDADFGAAVSQVNGQPQPAPGGLPAGDFFLLGAPGGDAHNTIAATPRGTVPAKTPLLTTATMQYQRTFPPSQPEELAAGLTVLLRRLANPHLPFDSRPSVPDAVGEPQPNPWYNPYLTIDYLAGVPLRNAATTGYASRGKRQPYAAAAAQQADQVSARKRQVTQHTFGLPNNPLPPSGRFDWLVHLDRELLSPVELLHVSGCQPHQLTQRFIQGGPPQAEQKFGHLAPWFDQTRRLYRFLEFAQARARDGYGRTPGGRVSGRINLNTIWDPETFLALCDPQSANGPNFTAANVLAIYNNLLALRTPGLVGGGGPGPSDRPFLSLATGSSLPDGQGNSDPQHPGRGSGINDTLLRAADPNADNLPGSGSAVARLFQLPNEEHPYRQHELLAKIYNQVTIRSNVFAVWLTVGFFEVTDDTTQPVKLGAEVGQSQGQNVRHRMFALVDRTAISHDPRPQPAFDPRRDPAVLHWRILE